MKIGLFILDVWCQPKDNQSIDIFQTIMHQPLLSICDKYDFTVRRFGFVEAFLNWQIPLTTFWKNDIIYNTLRNTLNKEFNNWNINISLTINESGV